MKTAMIARFVLGAGAIFAVAGLAGCGAGEQGSGDPVGSSEQAIGIKHSCDANVTDLATGYEAKFPGYVAIPGDDKVLVIGGYDHTGAGIRTVKVYDKSADTWTAKTSIPTTLSSTSFSARGEVEVALIPGTSDKFLVLGGRTSFNGTRISEPLIYDYNGGGADAWIKPSNDLSSVRVNFKLTACGSSGLLISGGDTGSASNKLEVFSYVAGTPASSSFDVLKNHNASPKTVTLAGARMFHDVIPLSSTRLLVLGGETGGSPLDTTEIINLQSSTTCVFDDTSTSVPLHPTTGPTMPDTRSQFVSFPVSLTYGPTTYEAWVGGGTSNGSDAPTSTFVYNDGVSPSWSTLATSPALSDGHVRPAFAPHGTTDFAVVGGLKLSAGHLVSSTAVDYLASGTFSSTPSLCTDRYGAWAAYLGTTYIAGMGVQHPNGAETSLTTVE